MSDAPTGDARSSYVTGQVVASDGGLALAV
jgi:hypothetical protein